MTERKTKASLIAILAFCAMPVPAHGQESYFRTRVLTTDVDAVGGIPVMLEQNGQVAFDFTDDAGFTGNLGIVPGLFATLTLGEGLAPGGQVVGQRLEAIAPIIGPVLNLTYHQEWAAMPLAEPVLLGAMRPQLPKRHGRWSLFAAPPVDPSFAPPDRFTASIAPLLNGKQVDAFFNYNSVTPVVSHEQAILIRSSGGDLGANGLVLSIDVAGHAYDPSFSPGVTTYFLADPLSDPSGVPAGMLTATVTASGAVVEGGRLLVRITGNLPRGDSLVALSLLPQSSVPSGPMKMIKSPPSFPIAAGTAEPPSVAPCVDCQPTLADYDGLSFVCEWADPPPQSQSGCYAGSSVGPDSKQTLSISAHICANEDGTETGLTIGESTTISTSTSVEWSGELKAGSAGSLSYSNDKTGSTEITVSSSFTTKPLGAGDNDPPCGQCHNLSQLDFSATKVTTWYADDSIFFGLIEVSCLKHVTTEVCTQTIGPKSAICSMHPPKPK